MIGATEFEMDCFAVQGHDGWRFFESGREVASGLTKDEVDSRFWFIRWIEGKPAPLFPGETALASGTVDHLRAELAE